MTIFRTLATFAALALTGCHRGEPANSLKHPGRGIDHCAMAAAALRAAVKTFAEQQYGLDSACVADYATANGKVYVDARFSDGHNFEVLPETSCVRDRFLIRFELHPYVPSPAQNVLRLTVQPEVGGTRAFILEMKRSDWPHEHLGTLVVPPCYPAFGRLLARTNGWGATILPPPQDSDHL